MTEPKRPWWMLHWPSWLGLVVFAGAFVVQHLIVNPGDWNGTVADLPLQYRVGMPFDACVAVENANFTTWQFDWIWTWNRPEHPEQFNPPITPPTYQLKWPAVFANMGFGIVVLMLAVTTIERFAKKHSLLISLRLIFAWVALAAAVVSNFRRFPLLFAVQLGAEVAFFVSLGVACLAVGLASLAVVDGIGWLFSRLSRQC